jgi:hypothetical protein
VVSLFFEQQATNISIHYRFYYYKFAKWRTSLSRIRELHMPKLMNKLPTPSLLAGRIRIARWTWAGDAKAAFKARLVRAQLQPGTRIGQPVGGARMQLQRRRPRSPSAARNRLCPIPPPTPLRTSPFLAMWASRGTDGDHRAPCPASGGHDVELERERSGRGGHER